MADALAKVKKTFGADAVILGTRSLGSGLDRLVGRPTVEITAAPPDTVTVAPRVRPAPVAPTPPAPATPVAATAPATAPSAQIAASDLPPHLEPLYLQLVQQEVGAELARRLVAQAARALPADHAPSPDAVATELRRFIADLVPAAGGIAVTPGTPRRVALVGPPGGGKTTTLAKLAAIFRLRQRCTVAVLSIDMHRLAGHAQLGRYGEIIGVPVFTAQTVGEVKDALREAGAPDVLLVDTPGIGLRDTARFARLAALLRAARPDEVHLVLPASLNPTCQQRMADAFRPLGISRLALTHLDDAAGLGVVLNAAERVSCELSYLADGQRVPADIEEACGTRVAELICPTK